MLRQVKLNELAETERRGCYEDVGQHCDVTWYIMKPVMVKTRVNHIPEMHGRKFDVSNLDVSKRCHLFAVCVGR